VRERERERPLLSMGREENGVRPQLANRHTA